MSGNPRNAQTEIHPPFFRGPTAPTSTSLGYPLQVEHEWMDTSGGIGVLRRCTAVDGGGVGTWALDGSAVVKLPLGDADTPGGVLAWQNPEGADVILRLALRVTVPAEAAATVDAGTAPDATAAAGDLMGPSPVDSAGVVDSFLYTGNGFGVVRLAAGDWLTISAHTGAMAGLAGFAYLSYHLA